jgi:uroporphyrinogen decarboxylase
MSNIKFQNALKRVPQATPPIWFMRQAGRYHKHYQALRAKHSFMELCKDAELAAEVAMGPVQDFDFDVAILFSDLLFPLEAMGMGLTYDPSPKLGWQLTEDRLKDLRSANEAFEGVKFQGPAVKRTRERLPQDKSLIGFVGGPWTLFTYAVEGEHKGGLKESKRGLKMFAPFCKTLLPLLKRNIQLQLESGAELVMIFDTAAGELDPHSYLTHVVPQLEALTAEFPKRVGYYIKGGTLAHLQHKFFQSGSPLAGLGYDHRFDLRDVLRSPQLGFVQGNFDQAFLFLNPNEFKIEAERYLTGIRALSLEQRAGWVCGLGHGVLPATPEENVRTYIKMAREILK